MLSWNGSYIEDVDEIFCCDPSKKIFLMKKDDITFKCIKRSSIDDFVLISDVLRSLFGCCRRGFHIAKVKGRRAILLQGEDLQLTDLLDEDRFNPFFVELLKKEILVSFILCQGSIKPQSVRVRRFKLKNDNIHSQTDDSISEEEDDHTSLRYLYVPIIYSDKVDLTTNNIDNKLLELVNIVGENHVHIQGILDSLLDDVHNIRQHYFEDYLQQKNLVTEDNLIVEIAQPATNRIKIQNLVDDIRSVIKLIDIHYLDYIDVIKDRISILQL